MRRISSRMTFFYKRVFPVMWFGFLALFIVVPFFSFSNAGHSAMPPLEFFIGPAIMAIVGYFVLKKLVFDLVDGVWDDGASVYVEVADPRGASRRWGVGG